MKEAYRVKVREVYSKWVDVNIEDESLIDQEIQEMEECGEIEWDRANDFDSWDIIYYEKRELLASEKKEVEDWACDIVRTTAIVDPDWVEEEVNEEECMDWFEELRDRGVHVPELATSCDLWEAVLKERGK